MKQTLNNFSRRFLGLGIVGLMVILAVGCQQTNNPANGNTAANGKSANSNTAVNGNSANSNTVAGNNANANKSASTPTNSNTASQNSESSKKDEATENKEDCQVKKDNANLYVAATDKDIKLKKGTSLIVPDMPMNQGIIVVKAKVGNEWIQGEIKLDDTTCN